MRRKKPSPPAAKEPTGEEALPALTPREEALASLLAQGNTSIAEACRQVGLSPRSGHLYSRVRSGDIRQFIQARMREHGLIVDAALLKLRDKMDAKDSKFFAHEGKIIDQRDVEAHGVQLEAAREVLKLYDAYPRRNETPVNPVVKILLMGGVDPAKMRASAMKQMQEINPQDA